MATVLLIVHLMIALALIGVVLLQRSEGGALGIGGGGGGGFMTGRGAANFLTRATAGLAAAFFFTSLVLTLIASQPDAALDPRSAAARPARHQAAEQAAQEGTARRQLPPLPPIDLSKTDPGAAAAGRIRPRCRSRSRRRSRVRDTR